jgi:hypothetical protein
MNLPSRTIWIKPAEVIVQADAPWRKRNAGGNAIVLFHALRLLLSNSESRTGIVLVASGTKRRRQVFAARVRNCR